MESQPSCGRDVQQTIAASGFARHSELEPPLITNRNCGASSNDSNASNIRIEPGPGDIVDSGNNEVISVRSHCTFSLSTLTIRYLRPRQVQHGVRATRSSLVNGAIALAMAGARLLSPSRSTALAPLCKDQILRCRRGTLCHKLRRKSFLLGFAICRRQQTLQQNAQNLRRRVTLAVGPSKVLRV